MSEVKTNKISSLASNNDITLDPDGTGDVVVASGNVMIGTTTEGLADYADTLTVADTDHAGITIRSGASSSGSLYFSDATSGSGEYDGYLNYNQSTQKLTVGTAAATRMTIDSSGSLLINTTSKAGSEQLSLIGGPAFNMAHASTGTIGVFRTSGISGSIVGSISITGSATAYNTSSDHRLKENVADMTGAIDRVKALAPKRFNFIADADTTVDGFLAHEAQVVVPEAVHGTHNEVDDDGNAVMQGIDQSKLVPLLVGALKESIAKIETLETKVAALEAGE